MKALIKLFMKAGDLVLEPAVFLSILGIVGVIALFAWAGGTDAEASSGDASGE